MATGSTFPIFIRPELQDGAPAFAEFKRIAGTASKQAADSFKADFREVTSVISNALTKGVQGGKLNLDVSQLRQASADAKLFGAALTDTLRTAQLLAAETGDTSGEMRQFILAIDAASRAQDENRRGIDAQIATYTRLQAGLDATASANGRLAQSYRETYAEAARMAQAEVANSRLGALIAPALGGPATSRGAGYSALDELAKQQIETDRLATASRQLSLELDVLRRAEVGLVEGAKITESVYRGTSAALDATKRSAAEAAVVFEQLFAAQAEVNGRRFEAFVAPAASTSALQNGAGYGELEKAARAADAYERQLAELRQQVDPLAFEQARVNKEMGFAADAYRRGDISADQLAARNQQLNTSLTQMRGGFRETRQGMIQVGQQMQDVAISFIGGQRAGTILAQQLPQLAFAMSNFGGKVGAVASVLSGPWSIALVAGSFLLGTLIDGLLGADDASKKAEKSTIDFANVLDTRLLSVTKFNDAIKQLNESTRGLIDTQALLADSSLATANIGVADAQQRLDALDKQIKALGPAPTGPLSIIPGFGEDPGTSARRDNLLRQRRELSDSLVSAENARAQAEMAIAQRKVDETIDRATGIKGDFDRQIAQLRQQRLESTRADSSDPAVVALERNRLGDRYLSQSEFERRYGELRRNQDAALDAQRKLDRSSNSTTRSPAQVLADFRRELEERGVKTISGYRTAAQQNALFRQGLTPADGYSKPSAHQSYRAVDIDKRTFNEKAIYDAAEAAGVRGLKILTESGGRKHLSFTGAGKPGEADPRAAERAQREAEQAQRAAEQLQRAIDQSAESVFSLRSQFDLAPRDIDRAANAVIDLNQAIDEADKKLKAGGLTDAQRGVVENTKRTAEQTRDTIIPEFLKRPLTDELSSSRERINAQRLLIQGRTAEYDLMEDSLELARLLGAESLDQLDTQIEQRGITKEMLDDYYKQQRALRQQSIELQNQQEQQQILLGIVEDIQSATKNAIYDLFDGKGLSAAKNFFNSLYDITKRQMTEEIYEAVFGDMFRKEKLKILGLDQVDETGKAMASAIRVTIDPIKDLGNAAAQAASQLRGSSIAANDNAAVDKISSSLPSIGGKAGAKNVGANSWLDEIVVTAGNGKTDGVTSELKKLNKATSEGFGKNGAVAKSLGGVGDKVSTAMRGAAMGEMTSGILKSLGIKQSKLGAQVGGGIGNLIGEATGIPGLGLVGGILGGTIGGLFKKTKQGFATIGGSGDGLSITGSGGNSNSAIKAGNQAAGATIDTLAQIAQALGGGYDASRGSVSIGRSGDSWHVDTTGRGRLKKSQGGLDFDDDYEAAVRAATMDLIKDGVITGLRASTQRLLQSGKDIDSALQKALDFESVFSRLKEYKDPVGAALDTLDKEFMRLKSVFAEAGASAAEYADLEELYGLERNKAIKEAAERLTASLKSLYDDLTIGDNGRSLRDRLSAAQAAYDPLKARVEAGDTSAYDAFAEAARSLLDIQREFSGSQTPYFNLLDEITQLTKQRIDAEKNISSIAENRDSPFTNGKATGANDNTAVVGAIGETNDILRNIGRLIAGGGGAGGGGFVTNPFL